jgi:histone deacetylase 6
MEVGALRGEADTLEAAIVAAGAAIEICRNVVMDIVKNAIAVTNPGHHAKRDEAFGSCIFNNVAVATRVCQEEFPEAYRKVLIIN